MGLQPTLEQFHSFQWELCRKRYRNIDSGLTMRLWCKRALTVGNVSGSLMDGDILFSQWLFLFGLRVLKSS